MTAADKLEVERFLHEQIPLTQTMGLRVVDDPRGFALTAPVALNSNHLRTAFGGSINALALLAGYGALWSLLRDRSDAHVVVQASSIKYLRPVRQEIRAVCLDLTSARSEEFERDLRRGRKARLSLRVVVEEEGETAAEFDGRFVALKD